MMRQLIKVNPSEYQPKYSPFTVLFFTLTFLACQKASLVSRMESSITIFSTY